MALRPPPLKSSPHLLCDWAELSALSNPLGKCRLSSIARFRDINREFEESDSEGWISREEYTDVQGVDGGDSDVFMDSMVDQIAEREEALGCSYPFALDRHNVLTIHKPSHWGGYMYLFCLMLAYSTDRELLDGTWIPAVDNKTRDLFQACSTVAAAGQIGGCAYSFGWPRPYRNPAFLPKLTQVYRHFGDGIVIGAPRRGMSPFVKDEEIDVVAWQLQPDRAPGTFYILGQVASGGDWMSKAIHGAPIENFHRNWFNPPPASPVSGCIFVPRIIEPIEPGSTRRERMDVLTKRFGIIIDRMRLPRLTQAGVAFRHACDDPALVIERLEDLDQICDWVLKEIAILHRAAA